MSARFSHEATMFKTLTACAVGLFASAVPAHAQPAALAGHTGVARAEAVLDRYCVTCHNARLRTAGLALDTLGHRAGRRAGRGVGEGRAQAAGPGHAASRPAAAGQGHLRRGRRHARSGPRPCRRRQSESRPHGHPSPQPRPSTRTRFATSWVSRSTGARCCRPTMRTWASTTWRTSCRCRPPGSSATWPRRGRSPASPWAIRPPRRRPRRTSSRNCGSRTTA